MQSTIGTCFLTFATRKYASSSRLRSCCASYASPDGRYIEST